MNKYESENIENIKNTSNTCSSDKGLHNKNN